MSGRFLMAAMVCGVLAVSAQTPSATVRVAADGSGQFKTVQAAIDSSTLPSVNIEIAPGIYREKLHINRDGIHLRGTGARPDDVVLTYDDSAGTSGGTSKSGSVNVTGDDFRAENLTIENNFEALHGRSEQGAQAVALYITGDRAVLTHVRLLGYQDTLYAASKSCHAAEDATQNTPCQASRQVFKDCYIAGHVDFIFGDAKAVFDHCELHGLKHSTVMLTAQSKLFPAEDSGYLFLDCTLTAESGVGQLVLGRPWRAYSTVIFVNLKTKGVAVDAAGWSEWAGKLATSTYAEYNTGPGADVSRRIAPSKQLTKTEGARLTVDEWVGGADHWRPE